MIGTSLWNKAIGVTGTRRDRGHETDHRRVLLSVGYRSSRLAQQLRVQNVENVFDLEGSLFKWANEGQPSTGSEPVLPVHPFDEDWGKLQHESRHPVTPSRIE